MRHHLLQLVPVILGAVLTGLPASAADMLVYFGSHKTGPDTGFSLAKFDPDSGSLSRPEFLQQSDAPSFFVIHPDRGQLYACNSIDTYLGGAEGTISAYALEPKSGKLRTLNRLPTGGAEPCFISLDRAGRYVLSANYNGGSICVFALRSDGSLGECTAFIQHTGHGINPRRQSAPHPHSIQVDPSNRFALVPDLGLDKVFIYRFNPQNGSLSTNEPPAELLPPGSGPRHLKFHPNGKFAYVISELANTVTAFQWDSAKGALSGAQAVSTLPPDFKGPSTAAEIQVHPNGKFVYATNRGHDSLAVFSVNMDTGALTPIGHAPTQGKMPRNFTFDPTGKWILLTNHDSDNAVVFRVNEKTGMPVQNGKPVSVPNPFCAAFLE